MTELVSSQEKSPEKVRSFFAAFGVDTSALSDEQVKKNLQTITENLPITPKDEKGSVDLAYEISTNYMSSAIQRFDRIDDKIQTLFTFAIGVFAIAPTLLKSNATEKINIYFWIGIASLILAGFISICARLYGKLIILNPKKIYDGGGLDLTSDDFKRSVIKVAANAYELNSKVIENKHRLSILSMTTFGIALISLVYWLVRYGF